MKNNENGFWKNCAAGAPIPSSNFGLLMNAGSKAIPDHAVAGYSPASVAPCPVWAIHIRQNVIGAVAPQNGQLFSLIVDGVDTGVFQFFLDAMARAVPRKAGVRQLLILRQCFLAQSSASPLASLRTEILARLPAGF